MCRVIKCMKGRLVSRELLVLVYRYRVWVRSAAWYRFTTRTYPISSIASGSRSFFTSGRPTLFYMQLEYCQSVSSMAESVCLIDVFFEELLRWKSSLYYRYLSTLNPKLDPTQNNPTHGCTQSLTLHLQLFRPDLCVHSGQTSSTIPPGTLKMQDRKIRDYRKCETKTRGRKMQDRKMRDQKMQEWKMKDLSGSGKRRTTM